MTFLVGASNFAQAAPTISSPYVTKGEAEIEWKNEYNFNDNNDDSWGTEIEAGYGITDFWKSSLGVEFEDEGAGDDINATALTFENIFQLAQPDALIVDPGLKLEYERSLNGGEDAIEAQLLLAKTVGKFENKSEFGVEREFGDDFEDKTSYNFAYGLYYHYVEGIELGAEWFSDFGDFEGGYDEQSHRVGPVVNFDVMDEAELQTGVLFGVSDAAPDATLKAALEFEF